MAMQCNNAPSVEDEEENVTVITEREILSGYPMVRLIFFKGLM